MSTHNTSNSTNSDKDDGEDSVQYPSYHSNVASIFGSSDSDGNWSLTDTALKLQTYQDKRTINSTATSSTMSSYSVIVANTVQTFRLVDGEYQNQGKMGAALISMRTEGNYVYQLLLYRDKLCHLCSVKITREFNFHIQPKNYCTFYEKQSGIWSVLFEAALEIMDFALQVAIAKWKSGDSTSPIMCQDIWCPENDDTKIAAVGDNVELNYTLHTISNIFKSIEESQSVSVEVETSGWTQGLMNVQPTTRRVIILQPSMLGNLNPEGVVYDSPVVIKLTVLHVTTPLKCSLSTVPKKERKNTAKGISENEPSAAESSAFPKGDPKGSKAKLRTRVARMRQALPFKTAGPMPSDSDETKEDQNARLHETVGHAVSKPCARYRHSLALQSPAHFHAVVGGNSPLISPLSLTQPFKRATSSYMVDNTYPISQLQSPTDMQFSMFFSEMKTANSELLMGINSLTDKMEDLHSKFDSCGQRAGEEDVTPVMERLLENRQQLKNQLEVVLIALQNLEILSESKPSVEYPNPASATCEPCQKCLTLGQTNTFLTEELKKLQEENEYFEINNTALKSSLQNSIVADKDQVVQVLVLQKQVEENQTTVSELKGRLQGLDEERKGAAENLHTANNCLNELQNTLREKQMTIDNLEHTLAKNKAIKIEDPKPIIGEHIIKILNAIYRLVKVQFDPHIMYDASFIQSVLAETFKGVTLEYLYGELLLGEVQQESPSPSNLQLENTAFSVLGQTQSTPVVCSDQAVRLKLLQNGDLLLPKGQQQGLSPGEPQAGYTTVSVVGQSQSSPTLNSPQVKSAEFMNQYLTRDHHSPLGSQSRICMAIYAEVSTEAELSIPRETIAAIPCTVSNKIEDDNVAVNSVTKAENESVAEGKGGKSELEPTTFIADSNSSQDVLSAQPTPPPLV